MTEGSAACWGLSVTAPNLEDEIVERLRLRGAFKDFSFAKLATFPDIS